MIKRLVLLALILIALGAAAAYYFVPWNKVLEQRITAFLQSRGMTDISFAIDRVGLHEATLNNVAVGKENPLILQSITLKYSPKELIDGNFQDLTLTGLDIQVIETESGWKIAGLDALMPAANGEKKPPMTMSDIIDLLPFASVNVTNSFLRIEGQKIKTALPFTASLIKTPKPALSMTVNASNITSGESDVALGLITINAAPDEKNAWAGTWTLQSLDMGEKMPFPTLAGAGTLSNTGNLYALEGILNSADKIYNATFKALYDAVNADKNTLTVTSVSFPFKEGVVSSKNIVIPLGTKKPITLNLNVRKVSIDALLQTLTGKRVTATGTVSGSIPVILKPDGSYSLGKGSLKADSNGMIQMAGDAIPGDNAQVALVRQILENLQYTVFTAAVDTTGGQGMVVRLALEGNNPDVYDGRIIKLNVNLTGDLLDFIQQNAMLFTNPEKLLENGNQ